MEPPAADPAQVLCDALFERFGERLDHDPALPELDDLARMSARRVCRRYLERDVAPDLLHLLCACALSAPPKRSTLAAVRSASFAITPAW